MTQIDASTLEEDLDNDIDDKMFTEDTKLGPRDTTQDLTSNRCIYPRWGPQRWWHHQQQDVHQEDQAGAEIVLFPFGSVLCTIGRNRRLTGCQFSKMKQAPFVTISYCAKSDPVFINENIPIQYANFTDTKSYLTQNSFSCCYFWIIYSPYQSLQS